MPSTISLAMLQLVEKGIRGPCDRRALPVDTLQILSSRSPGSSASAETSRVCIYRGAASSGPGSSLRTPDNWSDGPRIGSRTHSPPSCTAAGADIACGAQDPAVDEEAIRHMSQRGAIRIPPSRRMVSPLR